MNTLQMESAFIFLDGGAGGGDRGSESYFFSNPIKVITARLEDLTPDTLTDIFHDIERLAGKYYLAGYIPYETGYLLQPKLFGGREQAAGRLWFGAFEEPLEEANIETVRKLVPASTLPPETGVIRSDTGYDAYRQAVERIKEYIAAGDTYQVNYTMRLRFSFRGSPLLLYERLRASQPTAYGALIHHDDVWILSLSPELFFRIEDGIVTARPMKGTMPRGRTNDEDEEIAERLANDPKNRAENLMIVDLMRNDIGSIADIGSVRVTSLFDVERYRTVHQMTSTVQGQLRSDCTLPEMFRRLFPSGSVTGAPKLRTMKIIRNLEHTPRGVYTGAIGFISPKKKIVFNIPIRTIELTGESGTMGIGSGIVWDSDPAGEFEECLLKAKFLTEPAQPVRLIESLRYENGYLRLAAHLERLKNSARYFGIRFDSDRIHEHLESKTASLKSGTVYKVRILVDDAGRIAVEAGPVPAMLRQPVDVFISDERVDSRDRFLYHKTTARPLYDRIYADAAARGFFDAIFLNERDEITEGAISNVYVEREGKLITPPVSCGLLNGIYRQSLLQEGRATEGILRRDDLIDAKQIFLSNSVRGLVLARLRDRYE